MPNIVIRDCLEAVLLAGIKLWGLEFSEEDIRDGVKLFEDDAELVRAGECLGMSPQSLNSLVTYLCEHPDFLGSEEAHHALASAGERAQVRALVNDVAAALRKVEGTLLRQVDPEAFGTVLETLAFLAMGRFSIEVRQVCLGIGYPADSPEAVRRYTDSVANREWDMIKIVDRAVLASELGSVASTVVRRHARRVFSLAVCNRYPDLVAVLTEMAREIMDNVARRQSAS